MHGTFVHPMATAGARSLHEWQLSGREGSTRRHVALSTAAPVPFSRAPSWVAMAHRCKKQSGQGSATSHDGGFSKGTNLQACTRTQHGVLKKYAEEVLRLKQSLRQPHLLSGWQTHPILYVTHSPCISWNRLILVFYWLIGVHLEGTGEHLG